MFKPLSLVSSTCSSPALQHERRAREGHAEKCALVIFSAYNRAEFDDPQLAVANMVTMLSQYPAPVMTEVCNPRTGIQTAIKWPPKLSELREWCERIAGEHASRDRREQLNKHRVLIDTPHGPKPQAEAERIRQEDRDRAVRRWEQDVRPHLQTVQPSAATKGEPKGLSPEERQAFYLERAEELRRGRVPLPKLSAEALRTVRQGSADFYADDFMEAAE